MALIGQILLVISLLAAVDPAAKESRELFEEATAKYETSEYLGAVEKYTKAYELSFSIADPELKARVQAAILFNLARAHSKAYAIDKKREHLLVAKDLLEKYLKQDADLKNEADARQFQAETDEELERLQKEDAARREQEERLRKQEQERQREEAAARKKASAAASNDEPRPGGRGLMIGGFSLIGVGLASGGVAVAGGVIGERANEDYLKGPRGTDRDDAERKGQTGNVMLVAGSISAGVLITTGVVLAVVGRKRSSNTSTTTSSVFLTPGGGGFVLGGKF